MKMTIGTIMINRNHDENMFSRNSNDTRSSRPQLGLQLFSPVVGKYTIAEHEWKQAAFSRGKVDEWEYTWRGRTLNRGSINLWRGKNEQQ